MNTDVVKLVVFRIGEDLFAAEVLAVDRVLPLGDIGNAIVEMLESVRHVQ